MLPWQLRQSEIGHDQNNVNLETPHDPQVNAHETSPHGSSSFQDDCQSSSQDALPTSSSYHVPIWYEDDIVHQDCIAEGRLTL